jgi:hypothetical protein
MGEKAVINIQVPSQAGGDVFHQYSLRHSLLLSPLRGGKKNRWLKCPLSVFTLIGQGISGRREYKERNWGEKRDFDGFEGGKK